MDDRHVESTRPNPLDEWDRIDAEVRAWDDRSEASDDKSASPEPFDTPSVPRVRTFSSHNYRRESDLNDHAPRLPRNQSIATAAIETHFKDASTPKPLRRELESIHIFMIAISTVIGIGYYIKTGVILRIGGPAAVVYSYVFLGILTLMVTRNLAVMLRIWPVAGALTVFVESFVDRDVAKAVALMYWLSYSFSFAGLTTAIGDLVDFLNVSTGVSVLISILSLVVPIILNLTDIRVFRWIEFFFGAVKLTLAICIIIIMNVINPDVGENSSPRDGTIAPREVVFHYQENDYGGWFASISASIFLASFSILGIEIVAAAAQEANFETTSPKEKPSLGERTLDEGNELGHVRSQSRSEASMDYGLGRISRGSSIHEASQEPPMPTTTNKNPFSYAMWVPTVVTLVYVWGGWIVSQNINWEDDRLPTLEWGTALPEGASSSPFVNSANDSKFSRHLPIAMTSLLILHVVSTTSSILYVASRTLFGFAYTASIRLAGRRRTWRYKVVSTLATKNHFDVPYVAILVSAWLFWVPFLKYTSRRSFNSAINVITEMASVSCVIVWALESLAAFRFYRCYKKFNQNAPSVRQDIKSVAKVDDYTWYYGHLVISSLAIVLCVLIILVGGIMIVLLNPDPLQGVAAFSILLVFLVLTVALKWDKGGIREVLSWGIDLSDAEKVTDIFRDLEDQKKHNLERQERAPIRFWDFGGVVNSEWVTRQFRRRL